MEGEGFSPSHPPPPSSSFSFSLVWVGWGRQGGKAGGTMALGRWVAPMQGKGVGVLAPGFPSTNQGVWGGRVQEGRNPGV